MIAAGVTHPHTHPHRQIDEIIFSRNDQDGWNKCHTHSVRHVALPSRALIQLNECNKHQVAHQVDHQVAYSFNPPALLEFKFKCSTVFK